MNFLSQTTRGKIVRPICILVYGVDGVGKSTFAAQAPNPIFVGAERGTDQLDVVRFPSPKTFADTIAMVNELIEGEHDRKTVVFDTVDWMEMILFQDICERHNKKSIELAAGGFGKGYTETLTDWQKLILALENMRDKRAMNIIFLGHCEVVKFTDPQAQLEYQRYQLKLYKKASDKLREYVDAVLFANFSADAAVNGEKVTIVAEGEREMKTERRPGWDAKNRYGLPLSIPLDWNKFEALVKAGQPKSKEALMARIEGLKSSCTDEAFLATVNETVTKAGDDTYMLERIIERLAAALGDVA